MTGRLGGPDNWQTGEGLLQNGQVVLHASNRYRRIGHCRSTPLCYGCIRHRVQCRQNDGIMEMSLVGK